MQLRAPYGLIPAGSLTLHLHPAHLVDLRASGLNDETIRAASVYSLCPRDIALFFKSRRGVPEQIETALCFPYGSGEFARIKLFPALGKVKYRQPANTGARLYTPFPMRSGPIIVTEGEKKTLAAQQVGLNAIGIGGVWNWLSRGEPIDDLKLIDWNGREVMIIPDSDVFSRFDLRRAIYALARELRSHGAAVLIAKIPQNCVAKVGLDDYLVGAGSVGNLEVYSLSHRIFTSCQWWHGRWKLKAAVTT
jgi:hypothetical protein